MRKLALLHVIALIGCHRTLYLDEAGPPDMAICVGIAEFVADTGMFAQNETPSSVSGYAWDDYVEGSRSGNYPGGAQDFLYYYHLTKDATSPPPTLPYLVDLSTSTDDVIGLVYDLVPPTGPQNGKRYLASSGTVTVSAIDDTMPSGHVAVSGQNVLFTQTDATDTRTPDVPCVTVGSFALSATYTNP